MSSSRVVRLETVLAVRPPFHAAALLDFLAAHVVPGLEALDGATYVKVLRLPHGPAVAAIDLHPDRVDVLLELGDERDRAEAVLRLRHLLDLDVDAAAMDARLGADPVLAPLVAEAPGLRVPGTVDGFETAVRTVVGQQVSVAGAQTVTGRLVAAHGEPVDLDLAREHGLTHAFPGPDALAVADPETFSMPRSRARAIVDLAAAVDGGGVDLAADADPPRTRAQLLAQRGIGPWTADYVVMRALGDPDVLLDTDLVLRRELAGRSVTPSDAARWSPWRSYAGMHLWRASAAFDRIAP